MDEQTQSLVDKLKIMGLQISDDIKALLEKDPSQELEILGFHSDIGRARQIIIPYLIIRQSQYHYVGSFSPPQLVERVEWWQQQCGKENVMQISLREMTGLSQEDLSSFTPGFANLYVKGPLPPLS